MAKSISYYLTLWIIRIKGLKKIFSSDPIDYKKLRKDDIYEPKNICFKKKIFQFNILDTIISEIKNDENSGKLLLFIHGGAFISGPNQLHWDAIEKISKQTNYTIWMCNYPKSPEHKINNISKNIYYVYDLAIKNYSPNKIILLGDSAGGTLTIGLIQKLLKKNIILPNKIILISPVMDSTFTNPKIQEIENTDPILSITGVKSAKKMCSNNLSDTLISPINGCFVNFPNTILFLAENDITFPDQQLLLKKLNDANVNYKAFIGKDMPHIWPYLPFKESKVALKEIINYINTD